MLMKHDKPSHVETSIVSQLDFHRALFSRFPFSQEDSTKLLCHLLVPNFPIHLDECDTSRLVGF